MSTAHLAARYALEAHMLTACCNKQLSAYDLSPVGCTASNIAYGLSPMGCTASDITTLIAIAHLVARYALNAEGVVETSYFNMLTANYSRQLSAVLRYQTLWTDANWTDDIEEAYILQSELPADFVLSAYYAMSREMLALASNKKNKPKVKKVVTAGCAPEDYRVKRVYEPTVDLSKLNKGQLIAEVQKRDEEISSTHQDLKNASQQHASLKSANKKYELQTGNFSAQCTIDTKTIEELHNLVSDKETQLERAEVLTADSTQLIDEMSEAALKKQQSIAY